MKFLACALFIGAAALVCSAQDEKKEDMKVYRRLIPADVLRGE